MAITKPVILSEQGCFGGQQRFYEHNSKEIGLPMKFSVFLPPQAVHGDVPALVYLAGLTCNEEALMIKAGAQRLAAELGLALVAPDTIRAAQAWRANLRVGTLAWALAFTWTPRKSLGPSTGAWKAVSAKSFCHC